MAYFAENLKYSCRLAFFVFPTKVLHVMWGTTLHRSLQCILMLKEIHVIYRALYRALTFDYFSESTIGSLIHNKIRYNMHVSEARIQGCESALHVAFLYYVEFHNTTLEIQKLSSRYPTLLGLPCIRRCSRVLPLDLLKYVFHKQALAQVQWTSLLYTACLTKRRKKKNTRDFSTTLS